MNVLKQQRTLKPPSTHGGRLIWASAAAVLGAGVWAANAPLDQITRGPGQVIASSHTQIVQAADGGTMQHLYVREGDRVKRGQLLAAMDRARAESMVKESEARAAALHANISRLKAEVFGGKPHFPVEVKGYPEFQRNQSILFIKRQAAIREELSSLQSSLAIVKNELDMNLPLVRQGDVSRADILRLQRQVAELSGQITNRKNKYLQDSQTELSKAEEDLASVSQIKAQRQDALNNTRLTAPVDGVIKSVRMTTPGAVLKPGEELLSIVPAGDELVVEAKIKPADIAYLKKGLPATVKFDAWDYSIYGAFKGVVSYISADTLAEEGKHGDQLFYRVKISLPRQNFLNAKGKLIELQPGMTAQVDIKTGTRTVLQYLTKPITKTLLDSMGER
ncbi:HlyD family type I secretion periplasmic adaptor subunit [Chromobacterium sp. TRC.1.1.SA]|uniref:Membrane fusion protein (MFP) family protein n=1 Tax=Chromobacterium indicum TaxID=3110228 RepID=A0ABV0CLR4_9NEIS